jgi:hypothetical protein
MLNKTLVVVVATLSLSAAACKKKGGGGEALGKLQETADKVCAAKDLASATKIQEEYTKWAADWAKANAADGKAGALSEADAKAFADATKKLSDCYAKLGTAATPPAGDPPATPPAAGSDTAAGSAAAGSAAGSAAAAAGSDAPATPPAAGSADGSAK